MVKMRRRGRELSGPMQEWIEGKAMNRWTPTQINDYLQKLRPSSKEGTPDELETFLEQMKDDELPSYDKIRRVVLDMPPIRDTSGAWRVDDKNTRPEDLRCILDVLSWITVDTKGKQTSITNAEADWIVRIAKAAPGATSRTIWRATQRYRLLEAKGESTEALDTYLSLKPWEGIDRCANYNYMVKQGLIKEAPGRHEIDGTWEGIEVSGSLAYHFKTQSSQCNLIDDDSFTFRRMLVGGHWTQEQDKAMRKIRGQMLWLYYKILGVWDDAREREEQACRDASEKASEAMRALGDAAPDDAEDYWHAESDLQEHFHKYGACYDKYERLVDFFKDDAALKMDRKQIEEEFARIVNAPEEVQEGDKPEPEWFIELKKKGKKSKKGAKK